MRSTLCLLLALVCPAVGAAKPALQLSDMARIVDVEEPAISPRGDRVAFVAIEQDLPHASYVNNLVLVATHGGKPRVMARGKDVAVPRFSPDGSRLAYLARPSAGGFRQLFVQASDSKPRQITRAGGEVVDAEWSPDGRTIAYVAADPQRPPVYFFAGDNDYTAAAPTPADHLWTVPSAGGRSRRLTAGRWTIAPTDPGGIFSPQIAWTRDGRSIAFTRVENTFSGDSERSTLWQTDVGTGALRKLTTHADLELSPAYSPDGLRLAYWYPLNGDFNSENTLRLIENGTDRTLTQRLDRNIAGAQWFSDGRRLLICGSDRTQNVAWTIDLGGGTHALPLGELHMVCDPYSSSTFDAGIAADVARDGGIAFVATSTTSARELYYLAPGATVPRKLTGFNDFLHGVEVAPMSELILDWAQRLLRRWRRYVSSIFSLHPQRAIRCALDSWRPGLSSKRDFVFEQWPLGAIACRARIRRPPTQLPGERQSRQCIHDGHRARHC